MTKTESIIDIENRAYSIDEIVQELSKYSDKYYICKGSHSSAVIDSEFIFQLLSFLKD